MTAFTQLLDTKAPYNRAATALLKLLAVDRRTHPAHFNQQQINTGLLRHNTIHTNLPSSCHQLCTSPGVLYMWCGTKDVRTPCPCHNKTCNKGVKAKQLLYSAGCFGGTWWREGHKTPNYNLLLLIPCPPGIMQGCCAVTAVAPAALETKPCMLWVMQSERGPCHRSHQEGAGCQLQVGLRLPTSLLLHPTST